MRERPSDLTPPLFSTLGKQSSLLLLRRACERKCRAGEEVNSFDLIYPLPPAAQDGDGGNGFLSAAFVFTRRGRARIPLVCGSVTHSRWMEDDVAVVQHAWSIPLPMKPQGAERNKVFCRGICRWKEEEGAEGMRMWVVLKKRKTRIRAARTRGGNARLAPAAAHWTVQERPAATFTIDASVGRARPSVRPKRADTQRASIRRQAEKRTRAR